MIRPLILSLAALLPLALANAQNPTASTPQPATCTSSIGPGQTVTDSNGATVTNSGTNANGGVKVTYTGKLQNGVISGKITVVTNPASQGSNGPIEINTAGQPIEVNFDKRGSALLPIGGGVTGGNATVNVNGNSNNVTVGGTGNTVNVSGSNCHCGGGAQSGGTVSVGGSGSSFQTGGGSWSVGPASR